nr:hypothetical protein [Tanacetum cinerariifolium]
MTQKAINNLIPQRVIEAPAEYETQRNSVVNGDTSHTTRTGPRTMRATRECTYKDYLNCGPLKFKGTEGVIAYRGVPTCFECEAQGYFKNNCPKLRNRNQGNRNQGNQNQAGNGNTMARAYGVGTAKGNPDANVVTVP